MTVFSALERANVLWAYANRTPILAKHGRNLKSVRAYVKSMVLMRISRLMLSEGHVLMPTAPSSEGANEMHGL